MQFWLYLALHMLLHNLMPADRLTKFLLLQCDACQMQVKATYLVKCYKVDLSFAYAMLLILLEH